MVKLNIFYTELKSHEWRLFLFLCTIKIKSYLERDIWKYGSDYGWKCFLFGNILK
jgi:hypothetical protein